MSYQKTQSARPPDHQVLFALNELITATRDLADQIHEATTRLHSDLKLSSSERSVLLALRQGGPQTVPGLARGRGVSRQFIQTVVNELLVRELVVTSANPAHRRSKLVDLTPAGRELILTAMHREGKVLAELAGDLTATEIRDAARILRQVRRHIPE